MNETDGGIGGGVKNKKKKNEQKVKGCVKEWAGRRDENEGRKEVPRRYF